MHASAVKGKTGRSRQQNKEDYLGVQIKPAEVAQFVLTKNKQTKKQKQLNSTGKSKQNGRNLFWAGLGND